MRGVRTCTDPRTARSAPFLEFADVPLAAQLRSLALNVRALAVEPRAGALISRPRRQTHPVEQFRRLFMKHGSAVMGGGRT